MRDGELHEIKSAIILQPGPAALTDGLAEIHGHIARWATRSSKGTRTFKGDVTPLEGCVPLKVRVPLTGVQPVRRRSASRYFSTVPAITSGGNRGPGGRLFQSSVSR